MEIHIGDRIANVELVSKDENKVTIKIDDKLYELDVVMAENGICSILNKGKSFTAELKRSENGKKYTVNTAFNTFPVEIVDNQAKYLRNRRKDETDESQDRIYSPMPGKVVKILVDKGCEVEAGQPVIVIEAMKMQSEYKVKKTCTIKDILVKEGDAINSDQTLITLN
jgi:Acetyl/propionyl-CoA carboxylase, alpha subunit